MKRLSIPAAVLLVFGLGLTGCATDDSAVSSETAIGQYDLLAEYGFEGMDGQAIIDELDRLPVQDRPVSLLASVLSDQLVLTSEQATTSLELPDDSFYLSIAPFVQHTHECHNHSLTTCLGELSSEDVQVKIVDASGEIILEEDTTTFDNGFVGIWVPRGSAGIIEMSYDGMTGSTEFSTEDESPTCITTLQVA